MIYLMWGLLNIGLFLFFIVTCFRATKLVREKFGVFASIVFVFGLLSFVINTGTETGEPNSNQIKTWQFAAEDSLSRNAEFLMCVDLEKTLISKYELGIGYSKDKQRQLNIPVSAYSRTTGFISGTNWIPTTIIVNRTSDNNTFKYFVDGTTEWRLLGAKVYTQHKEYKGIAAIK